MTVERIEVSGARGPAGIEFAAPPVDGEFLVKAPGGARKVATASGTGADTGLRPDLSSSAPGKGAAIVALNGSSAGDILSPLTRGDASPIASRISAVGAAHLMPGEAFDETGVSLSTSQTVVGHNAVLIPQTAGPVFSLGGYSPLVEDVYLQGNSTTDKFYVSIGNSRGARIRNIYGANTGFGGIRFAPSTEASVAWIDGVFFEDVTGTGYLVQSKMSKIKLSGCEAYGKIDYAAGLGKPRAGSVGWRQNTPALGGIAVGGHQLVNCNMEALGTGWWLTDAQLSKFSNCIADGCSDYGLKIDGASIYLEFDGFFCGTSRGIYIGGTSSNIIFSGLRTIFTGVIPPWGAPDFFNSVSDFFDVTVADTASVQIDGNSWQGGKRVSVAAGASLVVTGGQRMSLTSAVAVPPSSVVYLKPGGGTASAEADALFRADFDGVLFLLQADSNDTPSSGNHVYMVRKMGSDTALTCSTATGSYNSRKFDGAITVARGETISVKLATGTGPAAVHHVFVQILPR